MNSAFKLQNTLSQLIDEWVQVSTEEFIISGKLLDIQNTLLRIDTKTGILIVPIENIIGIKCKELQNIVITDKNNEKMHGLHSILPQLMDESIYIQTKGSGEFGSIFNASINRTGSEIVIINKDVGIVIDKILFIEINKNFQ